MRLSKIDEMVKKNYDDKKLSRSGSSKKTLECKKKHVYRNYTAGYYYLLTSDA